ncbi:hypothetical protein LARV_00254 [Longilinea arvoryzae]|uniref:Uncharacterized protein n=1 Tax=Longilinea arvoryzae TaxID=360412 RepID=A0A0S7BDS3_9CHLR|nr:hypothetical protein [Longilinea arvoryzae]GAP12518.1 hypothetical protein LARV_00254 [Longilinea arvoryzae]
MKSKSIFAALAMLILVIGLFGIFQPVSAQDQAGTTLTAVVQEATPFYKVTYQWTLDKSVYPATWDLFAGDSGTSLYTVTATKSAGTLLGFIDGQVCVTNSGAEATQGLKIAVHVTLPPDTTDVALSTIVFQSGELAAGASQCYHIMAYVDPTLLAGKVFKLTADITIDNHSGHIGEPFGPSPSLTGNFPSSPNYVFNNSLDVSDTNGQSWHFTDTSVVNYSKTFTCNADEGRHDNTVSATQIINETPKPISDTASVQVNCHDLTVAKDASTSLQRKYTWSIDKIADFAALTLSPGQFYTVPYSVMVNVTGHTDSQFAASGNITVTNPAPMAATINAVSDGIAGGITASVVCPVSFPYSLAAGGTLNCTYSASLPDAADRLNTASAVLQNHAYGSNGSATPSGTTHFSGTANVSFASATINEVDECISVTDSMLGNLGTVCKNEAPKTFTYSVNVGGYGTCGEYYVDNTASFTTNDTFTPGSDNWRVTVTVPCATGCSLTPGYWKTHSSYGPAPYDGTWAQVGENTPFYLSGKSWYDVLWTTPQGGNAYYILAHAYIAAHLNQLNGADVSAVASQLAWAEGFFTTTLSKSTRTYVLSVASILDNYNNGLIGPGHCSE